MSMVEPTRYRPETDRPPDGVFLSADTGASWVVFAGTMIGLLSVLNMIYGIAAVSDSKVFVANTEFVYSGLHTWGWTLIAVSVVQAVTAIGLFAQAPLARWAGVAIAFVNAILQTLMLPALQWWSLALFVLDMLVIYGLLAHGAKEEE
jgi:hypothetical protein